ncbi:MAG TPA: AIR synthase-related protein, partial [Nitrolancea sp.]|nr:AIR synthase-related protein [Nitrolancea sp.]
LRPVYLTVDLNLPRAITRAQLAELWEAVDQSCRELGIAIVTGHTARYDGCNYPMVGGATIISLGARDAYVTPAMAQVGDAVIVTKGAAIEATGLFGVTFPQRISQALGPQVARAAEELFYQMTVVKDAMTAVEVGVRERGVTAMHDATECGVWGGLYEIAEASGVGMVIDQAAVPVAPAARAICDYFGMDPYSAISEGTLLLTCRPQAAQAVLDRLSGAGITASRVGEVVPAAHGVRLVEHGQERPLAHPRVDPFWEAYAKALSEGAG